jgi:hypothetical protein
MPHRSMHHGRPLHHLTHTARLARVLAGVLAYLLGVVSAAGGPGGS